MIELLNFQNIPALKDFITLFIGILVEAFPFVILGIIVSILVELFVSEEWLLRNLPKNKILSHIVISLLGFAMPVCECGNVPVVRRFLTKGLSLSHAVTFLLAAPIINPLTIGTTLIAFSLQPEVAVIRLLAAFVIANSFGILISRIAKQEMFLTKEFYAEVCNHDHSHAENKIQKSVDIFYKEFSSVFKMLIIGAGIASATQIFVPRSIITALGSNVLFSILAMILLAFIISICANVDAFFAIAYSQTFGIGAIVAFLVFGPMIDIKMLTMLKTTFTAKFLLIMTTFVTLSSILVGLMVSVFL